MPALALAALIFIVAVIALIAVAQLHRKRLDKKLRLEISNQGNVRSRYELKTEGAADALKFEFTLDGDRLPQQMVPVATGAAGKAEAGQPVAPRAPSPAAAQAPPSKTGGVGQTVSQAVGAGAAIASILTSLSLILPRSVAGPLAARASQLRMGQVKVGRAQRLQSRVSGLKPSASTPAPAPTPTAAPTPAPTSVAAPVAAVAQEAPGTKSVPGSWVQTPSVQPGETLVVDLSIRAITTHKGQHHLFQVVSRSIEQENAALVVEEGSVQIRGNFWTRRYLPYLIICATAVVALLLALWLTNASLPV